MRRPPCGSAHIGDIAACAMRKVLANPCKKLANAFALFAIEQMPAPMGVQTDSFCLTLEGIEMSRFTLPKNHMPPKHEPPPDELPRPVDPDPGPTPDLLPDDPSRDGVIQPVAQQTLF